MEFWGVEVQAGRPLKVTPEDGTLVHTWFEKACGETKRRGGSLALIAMAPQSERFVYPATKRIARFFEPSVHISHASLGDCKGKKGEAVTLNVKVGDKKFVMGTLLSESIPQTCFDMLFDQEFELSHNWGKGSVHFVGFQCPNNKDDEGGEDFSDSEEEEEEEVAATVAANGNAAKGVTKPKPEADDSDSEGMDEDGSDDEDDSEEEEETPKAETRRKRAHEVAPGPKTPVSAKKAKAEATPKKTEEKKKGGPATPHPAKKGGNTPATATQSPKSASQVSCGSCKKTFNSSNALESHTKAKHSATAK